MPLEFRGHAVLEADTGALRFAGFPTEKSCQTQVVICRIAKEALEILCPVGDPDPREALSYLWDRAFGLRLLITR
jgi:hypothetical protein